MMGIKHANPASLTSSLLDIGVFLIKVPTVEDKATADAIIDASTILRWANAALAVPTTTAKERRVWSLKAVSWPTDQWQRRNCNACYEAQVGCTHYPLF